MLYGKDGFGTDMQLNIESSRQSTIQTGGSEICCNVCIYKSNYNTQNWPLI